MIPPRLRAPPGACDTHVHVFDDRSPTVPGATFRPPGRAGAAEYRAVQRRLGLERVLLVQSSVYGTDNRVMLDAVAELGPGAAGVALVDAAATDAHLDALTQGGVRAARFLMEPGGVLGWDELEHIAARVAARGWFVNLQMDGRGIADRADLIASLAAPVVVDHVGMFIEPVTPDHPSFRALLRLTANGRTWVKLSAPYAGGRTGAPPYLAVGALARALAREAPDRLLWGSNWPHPFTTQVRRSPAEDDAMLLDLLLDWVEEPAVRDRILADNPAALLGFPPPGLDAAPDQG